MEEQRGRFCSVLFVFAGLKTFRSAQTIAGLWDVGWGRMGGGGHWSWEKWTSSGLTHTDLAWVSPSVLMAWFAPQRSAAVTQLRGRLETCLLPGGRSPPGPDCIERWGMGEDVRRGQNGMRNRMKEAVMRLRRHQCKIMQDEIGGDKIEVCSKNETRCRRDSEETGL